MHVYICTYVYICKNMCVYICIYMCVYVYVYMCIYIYVYIWARVPCYYPPIVWVPR